MFIPRVVTMYALIIIAFLIYITKIPERWFVGKVDFAGHSHNWWHLFVLAALYYWHNSGKLNAFVFITLILTILHVKEKFMHIFIIEVLISKFFFGKNYL